MFVKLFENKHEKENVSIVIKNSSSYFDIVCDMREEKIKRKNVTINYHISANTRCDISLFKSAIFAFLRVL